MNYKSNDTCNEYKRALAYYVSEVVFLKTNVDLGEMSTVAYPETCKVEGLQWDGGVGRCGGRWVSTNSVTLFLVPIAGKRITMCDCF